MMYKRCDIRDFLDKNITFWRGQRDEAKNNDYPSYARAISMIEAFQEVRLAVFEEEFPPENVPFSS